MKCDATPDRVSRRLDGRLEAAEARELEAHLGSCAACREEARLLEESVALLRALPRETPRPEFWRKAQQRIAEAPAPARSAPRYLRPALAAAVLLAAVAGAWKLGDRHGRSQAKPEPAPAIAAIPAPWLEEEAHEHAYRLGAFRRQLEQLSPLEPGAAARLIPAEYRMSRLRPQAERLRDASRGDDRTSNYAKAAVGHLDDLEPLLQSPKGDAAWTKQLEEWARSVGADSRISSVAPAARGESSEPEPIPGAAEDLQAYLKASSRLLAGDPNGAARNFREFSRAFPDSPFTSIAVTWEGHCWLEAGDLQEALVPLMGLVASGKIPADDRLMLLGMLQAHQTGPLGVDVPGVGHVELDPSMVVEMVSEIKTTTTVNLSMTLTPLPHEITIEGSLPESAMAAARAIRDALGEGVDVEDGPPRRIHILRTAWEKAKKDPGLAASLVRVKAVIPIEWPAGEGKAPK